MSRKENGFLAEFKKNKALFAMAAPAFVLVLVMSYLPMSGLVLAFKSYRYDMGVFGSPFNGLDNFKYLFSSGTGWLITRNTILYNLLNLITSQLIAVIIAIFISEIRHKKFKKVTQTVILMPYFISWVVVGVFVFSLLNYESGMINNIVQFFGGEPINFYQRIRYITIPSIRPTLITMILLQVGRILRGDFEMFYQIVGNNGQLFNATDVIDTYVFRSLVTNPDIGMTAAATLYQSVLCFVIIMVVNTIVKHIDEEYALF